MPRPRPPSPPGPRQLSVTRIERLIRDPYAIYARHVLKLSRSKPIAAAPIRRAAASSSTAPSATSSRPIRHALPPMSLAELEAPGQRHFEQIADYPGLFSFWWPRFRTHRATGWSSRSRSSATASRACMPRSKARIALSIADAAFPSHLPRRPYRRAEGRHGAHHRLQDRCRALGTRGARRDWRRSSPCRRRSSRAAASRPWRPWRDPRCPMCSSAAAIPPAKTRVRISARISRRCVAQHVAGLVKLLAAYRNAETSPICRAPDDEARGRCERLRPSLALPRMGACGRGQVSRATCTASDRQREASDPRSYGLGQCQCRLGQDACAGRPRDPPAARRARNPRSIMCLTFTKAAAAEMANRLFERLSAWVVLPER